MATNPDTKTPFEETQAPQQQYQPPSGPPPSQSSSSAGQQPHQTPPQTSESSAMYQPASNDTPGDVFAPPIPGFEPPPEYHAVVGAAQVPPPVVNKSSWVDDEKSNNAWGDEKAHFRDSQPSHQPEAGPSNPPPPLYRPPSGAPPQWGETIRSASARQRNPLEPLPPSFARHPPSNISYAPFPTMTLKGRSHKQLYNAFYIIPPTSGVHPHPFAIHDVMEGDWVRFLEDIQITAALPQAQKILTQALAVSRHIPVVGIVGAVASRVTSILGVNPSDRSIAAVARLIDIWNASFFGPRRIHVILAKGDRCLSGPNLAGIPPDLVNQGPLNTANYPYAQNQNQSSLSVSSSSDDSSDFSDSDDDHDDYRRYQQHFQTHYPGQPFPVNWREHRRMEREQRSQARERRRQEKRARRDLRRLEKSQWKSERKYERELRRQGRREGRSIRRTTRHLDQYYRLIVVPT